MPTGSSGPDATVLSNVADGTAPEEILADLQYLEAGYL
jgi:uncharacterized protein (DUF433 family)